MNWGFKMLAVLGRYGKRSQANQNEAGHRHGGESSGDILEFLRPICWGDRQGCNRNNVGPQNPKNPLKKKPYIYSGYLWVIVNPLICGILIMHVFFLCQLLNHSWPGWITFWARKNPAMFGSRAEEPGGQTVDFGGFPMYSVKLVLGQRDFTCDKHQLRGRCAVCFFLVAESFQLWWNSPFNQVPQIWSKNSAEMWVFDGLQLMSVTSFQTTPFQRKHGWWRASSMHPMMDEVSWTSCSWVKLVKFSFR